MNSGRTSPRRCAERGGARCRSGFTLAETLVALLFLAIVLPVTIEGLQLASYAGLVSQRKAVATRLADRLLNELVASGSWQGGTGSGTVEEGALQFRWTSRMDAWPEGTLRMLSVSVTYPVQGREQEVLLSTLVDTTFP